MLLVGIRQNVEVADVIESHCIPGVSVLKAFLPLRAASTPARDELTAILMGINASLQRLTADKGRLQDRPSARRSRLSSSYRSHPSFRQMKATGTTTTALEVKQKNVTKTAHSQAGDRETTFLIRMCAKGHRFIYKFPPSKFQGLDSKPTSLGGYRIPGFV